VITIVEDEHGTPLDVGRKRRTVTTALKRALWSRDRHCSFPGCHNRCYVDAHHIDHWADGGETNLENLTLLCSHHHTLLHEGGFKIRRDGDGAIYFQRPDGRVIPRFGYRLDDMRDDYVVAENPSTEVREEAAVYRVACG
jgi:HNH endonuclease